MALVYKPKPGLCSPNSSLETLAFHHAPHCIPHQTSSFTTSRPRRRGIPISVILSHPYQLTSQLPSVSQPDHAHSSASSAVSPIGKKRAPVELETAELLHQPTCTPPPRKSPASWNPAPDESESQLSNFNSLAIASPPPPPSYRCRETRSVLRFEGRGLDPTSFA